MALKRILLVEDEGIVAKDLELRLKTLGYEVCGWSTSGEDAVAKGAELRPDLVLMDIHLKGPMDGIEAAGQLRAERDIPVVFLTAHADEKTLERAKLTGPLGYILKPFEERDLHVSIEMALNKHEMDTLLKDREARQAALLEDLEKANEKLSEQKAFLTALFEANPAAILVVDERTRVQMSNKAIEKVFGLPRSQRVQFFPGDVLGCPNAHQGPEVCGTLEICQLCQVRTPILDALGGRRANRRRAEFAIMDDGGVRTLSLLVTAAPLDYKDSRLAVVILEDVTELSNLKKILKGESSFAGIVGDDPRMHEIYDAVRELAEVTVPVLVQGESGTGKELVAQAIHSQGPRAARNFVAVNCGALPDGLIESELFGHVKGSFTGAIRDKKGRFEIADGGTIFLDEVGDLSPAMQVKLLRVLESRSFERVGGERTVHVDARVISATNKDLMAEVRAGRFREDLYYRLCVVPITMPSLRGRPHNIPLLVQHLLEKSAAITGRPVSAIEPDALAALMEWPWPGNVRELQNALQFALIKAKEGAIRPEHLPHWVRSSAGPVPVKTHRRRKLTAALVQESLAAAGGDKNKAAQALGISRATIYRFIQANDLGNDAPGDNGVGG